MNHFARNPSMQRPRPPPNAHPSDLSAASHQRAAQSKRAADLPPPIFEDLTPEKLPVRGNHQPAIPSALGPNARPAPAHVLMNAVKGSTTQLPNSKPGGGPQDPRMVYAAPHDANGIKTSSARTFTPRAPQPGVQCQARVGTDPMHVDNARTVRGMPQGRAHAQAVSATQALPHPDARSLERGMSGGNLAGQAARREALIAAGNATVAHRPGAGVKGYDTLALSGPAGDQRRTPIQAIPPPPAPEAPRGYFVSARDFMAPFGVASSVDAAGLWKAQLDKARAARQERLKAGDDEANPPQWGDVNDVFSKQEGNIEKAMSVFNSLIQRYNRLTDIKNQVLGEKRGLTEQYRLAGGQLSTQCVTLQSSTNSVRLPEQKRRRVKHEDRGATFATQA